MKRRPHGITLTVAVLLGGCSSLPLPPHLQRDDEPTIGELDKVVLLPAPDVKVAERRAKAIRHYKDFLDESPENIFVPEALRRLADLNLAAEQEAVMEGSSLPNDGKSRAAELYAELLERYPDHPHSDTALYQLARAHEQVGELEPAMETLTQYTSRHPDGTRYDEAQFRRAEHLFMKHEYHQAELAYQAVTASGSGSAFYQQAMYKLGWARFKQSNYEGALLAHLRLLDENIGEHDSSALPTGLERADQERLDDTLRAASLSFAYLGDAQAMKDYYRRHGNRKYEPLLYAKLAALHLSRERFTDTAETYRTFVEAHPNHPEAPLFQSRVIDVFKQAGFSEQVLVEKQAFVERYQPSSNYWERHDRAQASEVLGQVQRHLRDIAQHYHAEAQRLKKPDMYSRAGRWYQIYLGEFATSDQAPLMSFLYAELLTSAGWHGQAAAQYEQTAYAYENHDKAAEAGYAALLAYAKHEATLTGAPRAEWHRAGIDSSLRFADHFSGHEQALPVRLRAAQQLYALNDYTAASDNAQLVVDRPEATKEMQLAGWTVIAHARFDLEDYERAEAAYQQVLSRYPANTDQRAKLHEKLAACIYKQGEQARTRGDLPAAAEHFLRVGKAVPDAAITATARYDAAAAYISLKRWPDAIQILESWRQHYPNHDLHADVTKKLAVLYSENSQPLQAAAEFSRIADTESDPELQREAAWSAATLYQQAGESSLSVAALLSYVEGFPQPVEQAMEARHQLVTLYDQAGDIRRQRHWQTRIIEADRTAGTERSDRTRFLAAHAQLALVGDELQAYRAVRLEEPLQKSLALKKKHMQATIDGFKVAMGYEIADVTTQATFQIGALYSDFSKALMTSERPTGLNTEELEQYDILLEEQAYPFEEKAIAIHEANVQRIADGLYDRWVKDSMTALATLLPVRYAKEEKSEKFVAKLQ